MADLNNRGTQEIEELLKRELPLLEVPQSLSAAAVAEKLRSTPEIRRTPVFVYVRAAVAAVLVLGIGLWTYVRFVSPDRKNAEAKEEAIYGYGTEDGSSGYPVPAPSDIGADGYSYNAADSTDGIPEEDSMKEDGAGAETAIALEGVGMEVGDTLTFGTGISFGGASVGTGSGTEDVCSAALVETEDGTADLIIEAIAPGTDEVTVFSGGVQVLHINVIVK